MKLYELFPSTKTSTNEQILDELNLRKAAAAAAFTAGAMLPQHFQGNKSEVPQKPISAQTQKPAISAEVAKLVQSIVKNYGVAEKDASQIVNLAYKYEKPVFPKAKDILSVIGIESGFDGDAVSRLHKDPAVGLMQVRPKVWGLSANSLNSYESQIKAGTNILDSYFKKLKNPEDVLHAYNMGITQFNKGARNDNYIQKFNKMRNALSL